jgi:hypothetical protein
MTHFERPAGRDPLSQVTPFSTPTDGTDCKLRQRGCCNIAACSSFCVVITEEGLQVCDVMLQICGMSWLSDMNLLQLC